MGALLGAGQPAPRSSVACRLISGTLASAPDNGPSRLAVAAIALKAGFVEAMHHGRQSPCDAVITKPSPCADSPTWACVSTVAVSNAAFCGLRKLENTRFGPK